MPFPSTLRRTVPAVALAATAALTVGAAPSQAAAPASVRTANACPTWTVTGNGVNFRTGAGTRYKAIGQLYRKDSGTKVAARGSWLKIKLDHRSKTGLAKGTTGWISKSYLRQCISMQLD